MVEHCTLEIARNVEYRQLILDGLNVQMVRLLATSFKRYFMNPKSGMNELQGWLEFHKWKKPWVVYARKAKREYMPLKMRIFKTIL
jgi:hypothetical protein